MEKELVTHSGETQLNDRQIKPRHHSDSFQQDFSLKLQVTVKVARFHDKI